MPTAIYSLYWRDVDPDRHAFDPEPATRIAERHILWATDGDRRLANPLSGRKRDAVEGSIDRELIGAYGAWTAGWRWAASEPGWGGPVRTWCCAEDSLFRRGDQDADASIDRVVAALGEWRGFLVDLGQRFARLREAAAGCPLEEAVERAAAALLPLVVERTQAEDAWYATFQQVLSWYLESSGLDPADVRGAVKRVVSGRFASWCAPSEEEAARACSALGVEVARAAAAARADTPVDGLAAWLSMRDRIRPAAAPGRIVPVCRDGHRLYIDGPERDRDPRRAERMAAALDTCRESARRGEALTFERLAAWQALVLDRPGIGFRTTDAHAKGGREIYPIAADTRARFEAALDQASDTEAAASLRAARAYLDVCFFHPFPDGNARAARLALDHVLTRAGLALHSAEPLFIVARAGNDDYGPATFAHLVEYLAGPVET